MVLPAAALPPPTVVVPPRGPGRLALTAELPALPAPPPRPGPRPPTIERPLPVSPAPQSVTVRRRGRPASRILLGLLVGLLVGFLVFGAAGYRAGTRSPTANAGQGPGQPSTVELLGGDAALATLATAWVPAATGCAAATAARGEQTHASCEVGGLSLHFVRFESVAERDGARQARRQGHDDAQRLAPGATQLLRRPSASHRTRGEYIEFAYVSGDGAGAPIVAGAWWDNGDEPVAAWVEAPWVKRLGSSWTPVRDAWNRYS
ncbi:hypothetical protein GCM10027575_61150 [Phytohabitans suffuscus]